MPGKWFILIISDSQAVERHRLPSVMIWRISPFGEKILVNMMLISFLCRQYSLKRYLNLTLKLFILFEIWIKSWWAFFNSFFERFTDTDLPYQFGLGIWFGLQCIFYVYRRSWRILGLLSIFGWIIFSSWCTPDIRIPLRWKALLNEIFLCYFIFCLSSASGRQYKNFRCT